MSMNQSQHPFVLQLMQLEKTLQSHEKTTGVQGLMTKTIGALTADEIEALKKVLGIPGRPYPMVGPAQVETANGDKVTTQRLGVLEDADNPLIIHSERTYAELVGIAYREMPTPSMLPMFYDALLRRQLDSDRRVQFIKGEPGAGKSFMAKMVARMRQNKGALFVDCGGKNLSELLYETVLDFNRDNRFYMELDRRLAQGQISDVSIAILKEALGESFSQENNRYAIDWAMVGRSNSDSSTDRTKLDGIITALEKVRRFENLDIGGNSLGMATQEGPLIRAFREGREIILDEYNKSKEGTDDVLQGVLQFIAGEISEHTVENKLKSKGEETTQTFTFRKADIKPGFFVTLTGNASEDGSTTRRLNRSVNSRLDPVTVPLATMEDWQHRICQIMTGLPISTLYKTSEAQWDSKPDLFRKKLLEWRTLGMKPEEIKNIPAIQLQLIENWQHALEASEKLARFYFGWSQAVNPNSKVMQSTNFSEIYMEIDEEYFNEVTVDFRKIIQHIEEGLRVKATVSGLDQAGGYDSGDWSKPPAVEKVEKEDPALHFGTRLTDAILGKVNATTHDVGKKALHAYMMKLAADCGLTEPDLKEGIKSASYKTVADLLDINPYKDNRLDVQVKLIQNLVCNHLRDKYGLDGADDDLVAKARVKWALEVLKDVDPQLSTHSSLLYVVNADLNQTGANPLTAVVTADATPGAGASGRLTADRLVDHEAVLSTLAMPKVGELNLKGFWNKALSATGLLSSGGDGVVDEALAMAEGESKTGLAITTVIASRDDGKAEQPLHVIRDQASNRTLVVGGAISRRLEATFKAAGIAYVDASKPRADQTAEIALGRFLRTRPAGTADQLKSALLLRNSLPGDSAKDMSLADVLVSNKLSADFPHYLTADAPTPPAQPGPTRAKAKGL